jgi:hypothetical protein
MIMNKQDFLDALRARWQACRPTWRPRRSTITNRLHRRRSGRPQRARDADDPEVEENRPDPARVRTARPSSKEDARQPAAPAGLAGGPVFNLFMVVPAAVYAACWRHAVRRRRSLYLAGIAITASGLSGANELVLDGPCATCSSMMTTAATAMTGAKPASPSATRASKYTTCPAPPAAAETPAVLARLRTGRGAGRQRHPHLDRHGPRCAHDANRVWHGDVARRHSIFLLSLVVTRYTLIGIKRYIAMNVSLLKGH